jgi:hypothetical protein
MPFVERFALGQDIIVGVQALSDGMVTTSITVAGISVGPLDAAGPTNGFTDRAVPVTPTVQGSPNTRRFHYSASIVAGSVTTSYSWGLHRIHNGDDVLTSGGSGGSITAPALLANGTGDRTIDYNDLLSETLRFEVSTVDAVAATFQCNITAYEVDWVPNIEVTGMKVLKTNLESERITLVDIFFGGSSFELRLVFNDETMTSKTITGRDKR